MWSHYASSHAGFVLEFDSRNDHFHRQKSDEDELRHLRRIQYRDARPSAALSDLDPVEMFLVKSVHWAYEREWRMLHALSEASEQIPAQPFPFCLFSFDRSAIRSVVIGARASEQTVSNIRQALASSPEYAHVRVRRAEPDPSHFLLRIRDD